VIEITERHIFVHDGEANNQRRRRCRLVAPMNSSRMRFFPLSLLRIVAFMCGIYAAFGRDLADL